VTGIDHAVVIRDDRVGVEAMAAAMCSASEPISAYIVKNLSDRRPTDRMEREDVETSFLASVPAIHTKAKTVSLSESKAVNTSITAEENRWPSPRFRNHQRLQ